MSDDSRPTRTLSEFDSKALLAPYGIPLLDEQLVSTPAEAATAADEVGFPLVMKLCGDTIAHKTERGLVRLGISSCSQAASTAADLLGAATAEDGEVRVLLAPQLESSREFIVGLHLDAQFGPTVMVGLGGIFAEVFEDVSFRLAPIDLATAEIMLDELQCSALLGEFRGEPAVDRAKMAKLLVGLSRVPADHPEVLAVDLNPVMIANGRPVAVDALVEVLL
ncbi:MAG: acetate--CoA ligase family protein [Acidimicrobiales bacterium]